MTGSERKYLIRKQGCYYRPNERGYTTSAIQAGRYTRDDAEKITHPNGKDGPRDGMSVIHEDELLGNDDVDCPECDGAGEVEAEPEEPDGDYEYERRRDAVMDRGLGYEERKYLVPMVRAQMGVMAPCGLGLPVWIIAFARVLSLLQERGQGDWLARQCQSGRQTIIRHK